MTVNPMTGSGTAMAGHDATRATLRPQLVGQSSKVPPEAEASKLKEAAQQFEAIFVRQLLKNSKITGSMGDSGYGSMALEALSSGVTERGGLGLARAIEHSIRHVSHAAPTVFPHPLPMKAHTP